MTGDEPGRLAWWGTLVAAWIVLCIPLLLVDVPPLADYPNHLARMDVLAHRRDVPFLADMVSTRWGIIPDLAMDSFMPGVLAMLPVHVAGRLLIAVMLLLTVMGAVSCATVLHGRRTWWSIGSVLVAYHYAVLQGFVNFDLTLAVGMLLAAGWMRLRCWRAAVAPSSGAAVAAVFGAAAAAGLFFGHLMGLFFYCVLIGSFEASLLWRRGQAGVLAGRALLGCWPVFGAALVSGVLYWFSALQGAGGETSWLPWRLRLIEVIAGVTNYDWTLDVFTACGLSGLLLVCAVRGRLRVAPGAVLALVLLGGLFPVMPNDIKGTSLVALRLAVMLGLLVFIAFRPRFDRRAGAVAGGAVAALFMVRMAVVCVAWFGYRTDVANIRALIGRIEPGDRVTQIDISRLDVPSYHDDAPLAWRLSDGLWTESHLMALVLIERRAFWTGLFVNPGQQPLVFTPAWQALAESGRDLPTYADLVLRRLQHDPPGANPFCAFDWIVLQGAWAEPHAQTLSPDWLDLVDANRTAALYHVRGARRCMLTPAPTFVRAANG